MNLVSDFSLLRASRVELNNNRIAIIIAIANYVTS